MEDLSLADMELGEEYTDEITGFKGRLTSRVISLAEPEQVLLENETHARWLPVSRVLTLDGEHIEESPMTQVEAVH